MKEVVIKKWPKRPNQNLEILFDGEKVIQLIFINDKPYYITNKGFFEFKEEDTIDVSYGQ
jgi:hypothetical protein